MYPCYWNGPQLQCPHFSLGKLRKIYIFTLNPDSITLEVYVATVCRPQIEGNSNQNYVRWRQFLNNTRSSGRITSLQRHPLRYVPSCISVNTITVRRKLVASYIYPFRLIGIIIALATTPSLLFLRVMLHISTAPLPMRYTRTTMGYTSMRYPSTALYFYKQFTQAPNKFFQKQFKQKRCK